MMSKFLQTFVLLAIVALNPTFARAECSEAPACHEHCNRVFHREEANHACHQECYAQHEACQTKSGASWEPTDEPPVGTGYLSS